MCLDNLGPIKDFGGGKGVVDCEEWDKHKESWVEGYGIEKNLGKNNFGGGGEVGAREWGFYEEGWVEGYGDESDFITFIFGEDRGGTEQVTTV